MAVIFIRIDDNEKQLLFLEAKKLGMQLSTYCRMLLLSSLNNKEIKKDKPVSYRGEYA